MAPESRIVAEVASRKPGALAWAGRRSVVVLAVALVTAIAANALFGNGDPAVNTATVPVVVGDVERSVLAAGTIRPAVMVSVGAQVSGQVTRLDVQIGQEVRKGDLIAEIDSAPQLSGLRNAVENLNHVRALRQARQAQLDQAYFELRRHTEMLKTSATPRARFDEAEATLKTREAEVAALDAQIAQAEASVATAKVNLDYTKIRAPVDGTVVAIVTRLGQTVNANQTTPTIIRLANLDAMVVKVQISEADVTKVRVGQEASFTILGEPDRRFSAILQSIELAPEFIADESPAPAASPIGTAKAIYYNGLLEVPNPDRKLRIAMTAQVTIVLDRARQVLVIPSAALLGPDAAGNRFVEVQSADGIISYRPVSVGLNNNVTAEVRSGLELGERVVIGPRSGGDARAAACPKPAP